ncbi:MAG: acyltransferase [bacterium]|nr:acyltransferase [bacterium]
MILAKIIQNWRRLLTSVRSLAYSKYLLETNGNVIFYGTPILGTPENIFIGRNSKIFHNVILRAGKRSKSLIIGDDCEIHSYTEIRVSGGSIVIGKKSSVNDFGLIISKGDIRIGDCVRIGSHTLIISGNHNFENPDMTVLEQGTRGEGIVIEDDVWIGGGVKILDGVTIGKGSVIAAGAVVTSNIPPYSVAAGLPAKVIKKREKKEQ